MRVISDLLLNAAIATRRFPRLFQKCLDAAFAVRKWELRVKPDPKLDAKFEEVERRRAFNTSLRAAVRGGISDVRNGLLAEEDEGFATTLEAPPTLVREYPQAVSEPAKDTLAYAILWGTESDRVAAISQWEKYFPEDPIPTAIPEAFVPSTFERITANGSFKVTPALRAKVRHLAKARKNCDLLVVFNKTNTAISLGVGELGDKGGVEIPVSDEPFVLTDHYSMNAWINSPDFRRAVAKDWIAVLAASPRPKFLKASPKDVTR